MLARWRNLTLGTWSNWIGCHGPAVDGQGGEVLAWRSGGNCLRVGGDGGAVDGQGGEGLSWRGDLALLIAADWVGCDWSSADGELGEVSECSR